ncbi:14230_t:CDS:2 [Funneliformis mosseae]|uniref:14230_t:CDS:1 n=1 Tax=Funneliformis mosseae TaxID=27381 RepID=A0A9N9BWH7_FUNMO|nr:14230_t:CDS:2 [Funneliformis mosseae]
MSYSNNISINKNKSILELKDAIKEKLQDTFWNIDTIDIKLWNMQIAQDDLRLDVLNKEEVNEVQYVTDKIKKHFKDTDNNNIHIIIQGKESGALEYQINNLDDEDEEDLESTFSNVISRNYLVIDNGGYNNIVGKDE